VTERRASETAAAAPVVVAGLGNEFRRDDGVGPAVAAEVGRQMGSAVDARPARDPLDLLDRWDGADLAIVVDALRGGDPPGTIRVLRFEAPGGSAEKAVGGHGVGAHSTHGIGLAGVLRLGVTLGVRPRAVAVVGVQGEDFGDGSGLSDPVAAAVPRAVDQVAQLIDDRVQVGGARPVGGPGGCA
jgi:hydrogenase maturation protease